MENDEISIEQEIAISEDEAFETNKPSILERISDFWYSVTDIIYVVRCVCCFTSLLTIICPLYWILQSFGIDFIDAGTFLDTLSGIIWGLGVLSGVIACPLRLLGAAFKIIGGAFMLGAVFLIIGALIGAAFGIGIAVMMIFFAPSIVTIPFYFNELRYRNQN